MTTGPIEFLGEEPGVDVPSSQYGGGSGLIQGPPHTMSASEVNAAMMRAAMYGDNADTGPIVDPATGRVLGPDLFHHV